MKGKQLGGRYEILDRVGGGGMAIVYKALDILLHRHVAVKILRLQYVHDEEFIERFRREAQAAASLSHSNIVSIYDVGQEEEIHYIVMEYIEGTTLNDLIKEKAPIQVEEAIRIACQICEALEHAHHNQIIHRDIKPHNILIGKNGRVKVTDFGIARAVTSSTITQTGSVMGSVHYFSPEHAKGTFTGEQSDLYSLGIVMYQMLTGKLPFIGESPISVALKHLQENVEDPRRVNPLIPQSVENVILRAVRKDPSDRYSSASQMLEDLESCLLPHRRNEAKLIFKDIDELDEEKTRVIPAIRPGQYAPMDEDDEDVYSKSEASYNGKKKRVWLKPVIWIVVLIGLLGGMWYMVGYVKASMKVQEVMVPDVVGKPLAVAQQMLKDVQLDNDVIREDSKDVPKDVVISQSSSNMKKLINSKITLHVSKGIDTQKMPNLVNSNLADAKMALMAMGIKEDRIAVDQQFEEKDPGTVLQQVPIVNEMIDPLKVNVKLTISKGKETFKMKDLIGLTEEAAKAWISANKLKLAASNVTTEASYKQPKGRVVRQFPYGHDEEVSPGYEITQLIISSGFPADAGPMTVKIPYKPAVEGKASTIKISLTDAQYDEFEYKSISNVTKAAEVEVKLVVAPDKNAIIKVRQDNELADLITVTYQDFLAQKNGKPFNPPTSGSGSAGSPAQTPTGAGNGAANKPTTPQAPGTGTPNTGAGTNPGTTPPANSGTTPPGGTGTGTTPTTGGTSTPPANPVPTPAAPTNTNTKPSNPTQTGG